MDALDAHAHAEGNISSSYNSGGVRDAPSCSSIISINSPVSPVNVGVGGDGLIGGGNEDVTSSKSSTECADIGFAVDRRHKLQGDELFNYLCHTWVPDKSFTFPAMKEGRQFRKFQYNWLTEFNWLTYSKEKTGGFCKYCVLFAGDGAGINSQVLIV